MSSGCINRLLWGSIVITKKMLMNWLKNKGAEWCEENAVTSIEYALLASLIAIVILGSVATTGENLSNAYSYVANCVKNLQCT